MDETPQHPVALAIIDMQQDFVLPGGAACVAGARTTVPALRTLLGLARARGWAVFHVHRLHEPDGSDAETTRRHLFAEGRGICVRGGEGARIIPELAPLPGEHLLVKRRFSAFFGTDFEARLRALGVRTLVIGGTQYPNCVRGTAVDALARDLRVVVVMDACSAQTDEIAAANVADMRNMGIACVPLAALEDTLGQTPPTPG